MAQFRMRLDDVCKRAEDLLGQDKFKGLIKDLSISHQQKRLWDLICMRHAAQLYGFYWADEPPSMFIDTDDAKALEFFK